MSENTNETNILSLDEFRKTHPKPSGKLYRDPNRKNAILKEKKAAQAQKSEANKTPNQNPPPNSPPNPKLDEAMRKYGSRTGNVMKNQFKNKEPLARDN